MEFYVLQGHCYLGVQGNSRQPDNNHDKSMLAWWNIKQHTWCSLQSRLSIWHTESHLVSTSRNNCKNGILTTSPSAFLNHPLSFPFKITSLKASRRIPELRIAQTTFRAWAIGSVGGGSESESLSLLTFFGPLPDQPTHGQHAQNWDLQHEQSTWFYGLLHRKSFEQNFQLLHHGGIVAGVVHCKMACLKNVN